MYPLVSVIVPVYNKRNTIRKCIESILKQTYSNIEVIIVDDGSTDNSLEICYEIQSLNGSLCVLHQENKGVSAARNYGLKNASGEFIMFVDSDDWLENNILQYMINEITLNTDIICCCCNAVNNEKKVINHFFEGNRVFKNTYESKRDLYFQLFDTSYGQPQQEVFTGIGVPWAKLYRKSFLDESGVFFDEKISHLEDNIFNFELFYLCNEVKYLDVPLYNYSTEHITTVLSNFDKKIIVSYLLATRKRYNFISDNVDLQKKDLQHKLCVESIKLLEIVVFNMILNGNRKVSRKMIVSDLKEVNDIFRISELLNNIDFELIKNKKVRLIYKLLISKRYNLIYFLYKIRSM